MPHLILIRHSNSKLDPDIPPYEWGLTDQGRQRCIPLAEQVRPYTPDVVVTSDEPKAIQTGQIVAEILDFPCQLAAGLHEHQLEGGPLMSGDQFRATVATLFARPADLIFGLETANEALNRFSRAVESILAKYPEQNIAIVSHGTVLSLFYGQITGEDACKFWQTLGLPAFYVVSRPDFRLISTVMQIQ